MDSTFAADNSSFGNKLSTSTGVSHESKKHDDSKPNPHEESTKKSVKHCESDGVVLVEDDFGIMFDEFGNQHTIKRFTWKNINNIEVQIITYGARVISMKFPDRKGFVDDIVLGFNNLASYLYYDRYNFGATIGRVSNYIRNATFVIDKQQFWVTKNRNSHHFNGGKVGFANKIWTSYVKGKEVILSCLSHDGEEGYPGDVLVKTTFCLSEKNEFKIKIEAQSTQPSPLNMSNLIFFNLAGQHMGPNELYNHTLTLNCNCFTPYGADELPNGEIINVVHTPHDFQVPKVLNKVIGLVPKDGIFQNMCINRGVEQEDCFVARLLHAKSGRMIEIYSNQCGVCVNTGNTFGTGELLVACDINTLKKNEKCANSFLNLTRNLHNCVMQELNRDSDRQYNEIKQLIEKIRKMKDNVAEYNKMLKKQKSNTPSVTSEISVKSVIEDEIGYMQLTNQQATYLKKILQFCDSIEDPIEPISELSNTVNLILEICGNQDDLEKAAEEEANINKISSDKLDSVEWQTNTNIKTCMDKPFTQTIPEYFKDGRIHGKNNVIYKRHAGIALQTQNYPNAVNVPNFPNCILRPGDTYLHTITYKFWIRGGHPAKWMRRNVKVA